MIGRGSPVALSRPSRSRSPSPVGGANSPPLVSRDSICNNNNSSSTDGPYSRLPVSPTSRGGRSPPSRSPSPKTFSPPSNKSFSISSILSRDDPKKDVVSGELTLGLSPSHDALAARLVFYSNINRKYIYIVPQISISYHDFYSKFIYYDLK